MKDSLEDVLTFWFVETSPSLWFQTNPDFDAQIRTRFMDEYDSAAQGLREDWMSKPEGCLALCLLLDQFPRNMFRGTAKAYASDARAILISKHAVLKGFDQIFRPVRRRFLYLPFEHSESLSDQKRSVQLFESMKEDDPLGYEYAMRHYKVIDQFGRFPHRNAVLGRESTPEELAFLHQTPGGF